ncbi:MAG: FliH/SctL family protein [Proteobacteria bacterium]|nr:FliH/SctL family protein [Pseudomonadota bacterium]
MHYEGPRRQGRFIKKGSKVLEKVSLKHFSFHEISNAKVISHDNYKRTIIHSQYHEEQELAESVRDPEKFNQDLTPQDLMRPIIQLTDFTKDWERDRLLRKDRVMRAEDEEFDYELEQQQRRQQEEAELERLAAEQAASAQQQAQAAESPVVAKSTPIPSTQPTATKGPSSKAEVLPNEKSVGPMITGRDAQWASVEEAGQAIKSLHLSAPQMPSQPPQRPVREQESSASDDFIPVHDPEQEAARSYQVRQEQLAEQQAQVESLREAATAAGYQEGFRAGEEKGELQVRQNATQMFGKVAELVQEFAKLKASILDNVQENFYELCQAMAESLLKREFSIQPEAFVTVMRRAISEAVEPTQFRIHIHPELYDRLYPIAPADLKDSLLKDSEVQLGDFKIESNLSVVDGQVHKIISDLLAKADLHLFDEEDKAS